MREIKSTQQFNADVRQRSGVVVLDFYADWCGPCQNIRFLVDEHKDAVEQIEFVKINVDIEENAALLKEFGVRSIPTLVRMENGIEAKRFIGLPSSEQFAELVGG